MSTSEPQWISANEVRKRLRIAPGRVKEVTEAAGIRLSRRTLRQNGKLGFHVLYHAGDVDRHAASEGQWISACEAGRRLGIDHKRVARVAGKAGIRSRTLPGRSPQYHAGDLERVRAETSGDQGVGT